jgi:D-alanine-D-alanine ligase
VLIYSDEGRDCRYSAKLISAAMSRSMQVLVLRSGNPDADIINQRRGWRRYELSVQGAAGRVGAVQKRPDVLQWSMERLQRAFDLTSRNQRIAVAARDIHTDSYPRHLPHRFGCTLLLNYGDSHKADETEDAIRKILGKKEYRWELNLISDRPPMKKRKRNERISRAYRRLAEELEIPLALESSLYPSVAGLAPANPAVMCGIGPVAHHVFTPEEALSRISLMQRTLLLARYLQTQVKNSPRK